MAKSLELCRRKCDQPAIGSVAIFSGRLAGTLLQLVILLRMPTYRATVLDKQKRPLLRTTFDAISEPEALERARNIAHGREVEIERLGHPVAHIPADEKSRRHSWSAPTVGQLGCDFFRTKFRICEKEPVPPLTVGADNHNYIEPLARIGRGVHQDAAFELLLCGGAEEPEHRWSPSGKECHAFRDIPVNSILRRGREVSVFPTTAKRYVDEAIDLCVRQPSTGDLCRERTRWSSLLAPPCGAASTYPAMMQRRWGNLRMATNSLGSPFFSIHAGLHVIWRMGKIRVIHELAAHQRRNRSLLP
jgi:hypothetical protein